MTSFNSYLDVLKSSAKVIQEKAAKISDAVDVQLQKTQENLERKRSKVVATSDTDLLPRVWRSSSENPLGEFIDPPPPPPSPSPSSASSPPPPASPLPERPRTLTVDYEPKTVTRKKSRRKKLAELDNEIDRKQDVRQCLKHIIDQIVDQEASEAAAIAATQHFISPINPPDELTPKSPDIIIPSISITEEPPEPTITTNETIEQPSEDFLSPQENILEQSTSSENYNFEIPDTILNTPEIETSLCLSKTETESDSQFDSSLEKSSAWLDNFSIQTPEQPTLPTIDEVPTVPKNPQPIPEPAAAVIPPIKKEKCFSSLNAYTLPSDVIVSHMSCSATQIYICTTKHILFYTRVPETNVYHSLTWYRYNLPADQLLVSPTSKTIWRIYDERIYYSCDAVKLTPLGIHWKEFKIPKVDNIISLSMTDQYVWFIKEDGTLWLMKTDSESNQPINVLCMFTLRYVVCSTDSVAILTSDEQILIRSGCTNDCPEGGGWIFLEHNFGSFDSFSLMKNANIICIIDKKHRVWIHDWSSQGKFYEVLKNDEYKFKKSVDPFLLDVNNNFLCFTDCHEQLYIFSNCLTGIHWVLVEKGTRLQRLVGTFPNEDFIWALTTDGNIQTSNGQVLEKPRQAQYITHASFVPHQFSQRIVWSLDESCNIYTRNILDENSNWEQLDQSQFGWSRRLVDIGCNSLGVWAVDDRGCVFFRYGHISSSDEYSFLNAAWIEIPGDPVYHRSFVHIFCGPEDWMVYATDNKQAVYSRIGIEKTNPVGNTWKMIEDCTALGLAISEHTLWLLTSRGRIQCHENISLENSIGTRTTILPGRFNSISVSTDDDHMWALYPPHHLYKLDRLTVLFDK